MQLCRVVLHCIAFCPLHSHTTLSHSRSLSLSHPLSPLPPYIHTHTNTHTLGMRYIAEQLLLKDQKLRMGMGGMLLHPLLHQKTNAFPALYKPKTVEERIRRGQSRQLTSQVEGLLFSKNSSLLGHNVSVVKCSVV